MADKCSISETKYGGFDSLAVSNGRIRLEIVPELGGKIASIQDLVSGREWLWRNPHLPLKPVVYDASYVADFDTGGIDECFPAVSGGKYPRAPWQESTIPDHGELWCQPWEIEQLETSTARIVLAMRCHGVRFPYHFERRLTMENDSPAIRLDYRLSNPSPFEMPFLWCIHPILRIEAGMQVRLPAGVETVRVDSGDQGLSGRMPWPRLAGEDGQVLDLSRVPEKTAGRAIKIYTEPLQGEEEVETAVLTPDGRHGFAFRFHPQEITHVGLWLNFGGWSGSGSEPYFNLGLEPAIGGKDSLADAMQIDEYAMLPPGQQRSWRLDLRIT